MPDKTFSLSKAIGEMLSGGILTGLERTVHYELAREAESAPEYREAAAGLAKEMYLFLSTNGWEAFMAHYRAAGMSLRRDIVSASKSIELPELLPFTGVTLEPRTDTKFYGAGVDPLLDN